MEEKQKYFSLLDRLCENIHGAIKTGELLTYLPINYSGICATICDKQFNVVINDAVQSKVYEQDGCYENIAILQRLVYKYKIVLKSDNITEKLKFQTKVLKLIKENIQ